MFFLCRKTCKPSACSAWTRHMVFQSMRTGDWRCRVGRLANRSQLKCWILQTLAMNSANFGKFPIYKIIARSFLDRFGSFWMLWRWPLELPRLQDTNRTQFDQFDIDLEYESNWERPVQMKQGSAAWLVSLMHNSVFCWSVFCWTRRRGREPWWFASGAAQHVQQPMDCCRFVQLNHCFHVETWFRLLPRLLQFLPVSQLRFSDNSS